ncbi:MAG TPA: hypothetical protein VMK42_06410 [Anaeromyxobacteraceae bacterium]|nr:hypothetical protein [Anaeromyxobacteraceae bacterium]
MKPAPGAELVPTEPARRSVVRRLLVYASCIAVAVAAFGAHEYFKLHRQSVASLVSLLAAAGFGLVPVRALARELLSIEGTVLHLVHGIGGLALLGLALTGVISGGPVLTRAALAPFAIMGAAQAVMHQGHPRSAEQAEALRRFATSLPEVEQFTKSGDLSSPANVRRAIAVLTDLVTKAEVLGETELRSDPGFQSALKRATTRFGLSLGLDAADRAIGKLAGSPEAARALPDLRRRLAAARKVVASDG